MRQAQPVTRRSPEVGSIIRLIMRSDVVLPHPEGPTSTVMRPDGAVSDSPSTAVVPSGYTLRTSVKVIMDAHGTCCPPAPGRGMHRGTPATQGLLGALPRSG